jgi:lipopolysaccharide export system protein LptA
MRAPALPFLALLVPLAAPASAQSRHDTNAPINFGAGHIELQDKANRVVLTGAVVVTQAEMTLNAQRMTVAYTGQVTDGHPQATRIDAAGDVVVKRPDQTATGRFGVYDIGRHLVTMLGGVTLHQGANTVAGSRMTINLDTGRAVIDGSSVPGGGAGVPGVAQAAPGGRVTGTFSVPKRDDAAPAPAR